MNHKESDIPCASIKSALIVGKNKNNDRVSNAVGKTTIYNAIEYALFNKSHSTNLDKVVKDGAKKCVVEFDFEINGKAYRIKRSRYAKGTAADMLLYQIDDGKLTDISGATPSKTEEKLAEIVKLTHKAFEISVLFRQADLTGLTTVDPQKRIELLKEPMNLSKYTKLEKLVAEKVKPIKKDIAKTETTIEMFGDPESDVNASKIELKACHKSISQKEQAVNVDLVRAIQQKKQALETIKSTLGSADTEIHNKAEQQKQRAADISKRINKIAESIQETKQEINQNIILQTQSIKENNDLADKIAILEQIKYTPISELETKLSKVLADEIKGEKLIAECGFEIKQAQQNIPESDSCPACHQSITEDYRHTCKEESERIIKSKQTDIVFYTEALTKCKNKKQSINNEILEVRAHEKELNRAKMTLDHQKASLKMVKSQVESAQKRLVDLETQMANTSAELQEAIKHYDTLKEAAQKSNVADINDKLFVLSDEIRMCEESREAMQVEISSLKTKEGGLQERINSRTEDKNKLEAAKKELNTLLYNLKIHQLTANAFSHKGIPTFIIHTILDELQYETNCALKELRPELEIALDAELNITYKRNGAEREYGQLSHGQRVYVALSFKRGLSRVIQKKIGVDSVMLMMFDEVDANMDKAGVDTFARAVRQWQNDFVIFVITHNDELKDLFSHAILVEEDDNGSEARLVNSW
jgi:DNA repair exonuclease SbcCD ATPase subunit